MSVWRGSLPVGVRGRPVQIQVKGEDLASIDLASKQIADSLGHVRGVVDVDRSLKAGRPERILELLEKVNA